MNTDQRGQLIAINTLQRKTMFTGSMKAVSAAGPCPSASIRVDLRFNCSFLG